MHLIPPLNHHRMFQLLALLIFLISLPIGIIGNSGGDVKFSIGALLSSTKSMGHFNSSINDVRARVSGKQVSFTPLTELLASNALKASKQLCSMLIAGKGRLFAVVVSNPPNSPSIPPLSVSFVAALYGLPVIGVTTRQAVFSDKYAHASFLRTVPPYSVEARVWAQLIGAFEWHEVCLIHSDNNQDSKALISLLEVARQTVDFKITQSIGVNTDEEDVVNLGELQRKLEGIQKGQTRAILLFVTRRYAEHVFTVAERLEIVGREWAWLVSEQCLGAKNIPLGVLSLRLAQSDELLHIEDAARVVTEGIVRLTRREHNAMFELQSVKNCNQEIEMFDRISQNNYSWLDYSVKLYRSMIDVVLEDGETGHVEFDSRGDRVGSQYDIVNVQPRSHCDVTKSSCKPVLNTVGKYVHTQRGSKQPRLSIEMSRIYWPGNYRQMKATDECIRKGSQTKECAMRFLPPPSFKKKTHLKVVTIQSTPFVDHIPKPPGGRCNTSDRVEDLKFQVPCTHTNASTGKVTEYCCYGYCIDLLRRLANRTDPYENATTFTYELHLVGDGQMGEELVGAMNETKMWTGIVGELTTGMADLSVAPMTITPERVTRLEFTKPFKYLGITILVKKERLKSNLASFLQPFESTLWVLVGISVHVVALFLYLLDRYSAIRVLHRKESKEAANATSSTNNNCGSGFDANQEDGSGSKTKKDEEFNLSSSMWFTWGILLNSGIGDETPKALSTRALGMVWAGFTMIIVASYTANLAAFLVLDRPEASISGIDDPRLRNPQNDFTFATVRGSSVDMYFKSQVELDTIYRTMEGCNVDSVEEGIQAVKQGTLKAFIWDSARLNYEASRDCDLVTTGDVFGRMGYGLAMKKGNPWIYEISQAVLSFHERGFMEQLDTQWIFNSGESEKCAKTESSPATLELTNMAGVFIMVAVGIVVGLVLLLVEIACSRRKGIRARRIACARRAGNRWRKKIEKKRRNPTPRSMETSAAPVFVDECSRLIATESFPMIPTSSRVDHRLPQVVQISTVKTGNNLVCQQPTENVCTKVQRIKAVEHKLVTSAKKSVKSLQI